MIASYWRFKMNKAYGITQAHLVMYRLLISLGKGHDDCMEQLRLTYQGMKRAYSDANDN